MAWVRSFLHLDAPLPPPVRDERLAAAEAALAIQRRKLEATRRTAAEAAAATDSLAEAVDRALRGRR